MSITVSVFFLNLEFDFVFIKAEAKDSFGALNVERARVLC